MIGAPARPDPSLLGLRHAGARAAERASGGGRLGARAPPVAGAPDRRDRRVRGALLKPKSRAAAGRRPGVRPRPQARRATIKASSARLPPRVPSTGSERRRRCAARAPREPEASARRSSASVCSASWALWRSRRRRSESSWSSRPAAATTPGRRNDPPGGSIPEQKVFDLDQAARAADCELKSNKATSREHLQTQSERQLPTTRRPAAGASRSRRRTGSTTARRRRTQRWCTRSSTGG